MHMGSRACYMDSEPSELCAFKRFQSVIVLADMLNLNR
jgi:hypothetical protein